MINRLLAIAILAMILSAPAFAAGDAAAGKAKSTVCAACHGPAGISTAPIWPNLAGQKEAYLVKQMKDYRDGKRQDASMAPMVMNLTDQDIEDLAAFYSSQPAQ